MKSCENLGIVRNDRSLYLDLGVLKFSNGFQNEDTTFVYCDAASRPRSLLLDVTNSRVNAVGNIFEKAEKVQRAMHDGGAGDVCVICVYGAGIAFKLPHSESQHDSGWIVAQGDCRRSNASRIVNWAAWEDVQKTAPNQQGVIQLDAPYIAKTAASIKAAAYQTVGTTLEFLDRWAGVGLECPVFVFGYSRVQRGESFRSNQRVPTHMISCLAPSLSIEKIVQSVGRATFLGKERLEENGFSHVTLLTTAQDQAIIGAYYDLLRALLDKMQSEGFRNGVSLARIFRESDFGWMQDLTTTTRSIGQRNAELLPLFAAHFRQRDETKELPLTHQHVLWSLLVDTFPMERAVALAVINLLQSRAIAAGSDKDAWMPSDDIKRYIMRHWAPLGLPYKPSFEQYSHWKKVLLQFFLQEKKSKAGASCRVTMNSIVPHFRDYPFATLDAKCQRWLLFMVLDGINPNEYTPLALQPVEMMHMSNLHDSHLGESEQDLSSNLGKLHLVCLGGVATGAFSDADDHGHPGTLLDQFGAVALQLCIEVGGGGTGDPMAYDAVAVEAQSKAIRQGVVGLLREWGPGHQLPLLGITLGAYCAATGIGSQDSADSCPDDAFERYCCHVDSGAAHGNFATLAAASVFLERQVLVVTDACSIPVTTGLLAGSRIAAEGTQTALTIAYSRREGGYYGTVPQASLKARTPISAARPSISKQRVIKVMRLLQQSISTAELTQRLELVSQQHITRLESVLEALVIEKIIVQQVDQTGSKSWSLGKICPGPRMTWLLPPAYWATRWNSRPVVMRPLTPGRQLRCEVTSCSCNEPATIRRHDCGGYPRRDQKAARCYPHFGTFPPRLLSPISSDQFCAVSTNLCSFRPISPYSLHTPTQLRSPLVPQATPDAAKQFRTHRPR